jgi:hypothetical protein
MDDQQEQNNPAGFHGITPLSLSAYRFDEATCPEGNFWQRI